MIFHFSPRNSASDKRSGVHSNKIIIQLDSFIYFPSRRGSAIRFPLREYNLKNYIIFSKVMFYRGVTRTTTKKSTINVHFFPLQMLTQTILSGIRTASFGVRRNFGIVAPAMQKASDPVQQLFLDKLREYKSKSK